MIFTTHLRGPAPPVLVPEGFSIWAALFGPFWLLAHRAWIPACLLLAAGLAVGRADQILASPAPLLGLMLLQGLCGRDLVRWGLARRGYAEGPVVAGADRDSAFARLLDNSPDLQRTLAGTAG
jgi:hypothetical protein